MALIRSVHPRERLVCFVIQLLQYLLGAIQLEVPIQLEALIYCQECHRGASRFSRARVSRDPQLPNQELQRRLRMSADHGG